MNLQEAKKIYKHEIDEDILFEYREPDKFFYMNSDDPDLRAIKISLPEAPDFKLIDGWGLKAKKQKFQYSKYPDKLKKLEAEVNKNMSEELASNPNRSITPQRFIYRMWKELSENTKKYYEEIQWIKREWWHIVNGYWFFCNGKPTYIDGWHYRYLNYWHMGDVVHPEYRDANRRSYLFGRFAYTLTQDANSYDLGRRLCMGVIHPKHRRNGDTFMWLCAGWDIVTAETHAQMGIQSYNDKNAKEHYSTKLLNAFNKMAFFLKPMWKGYAMPETGLVFRSPSYLNVKSLGGSIDYATTASFDYYDGSRKKFLQMEEEGKTVLEQVDARWEKYKPVLSTGGNIDIYGFSAHPSTVEEMEEGGGARFKKMCDESNFYKRNEDTGQTSTGLLRYFIPAYDGLQGFIDEYGNSIIEDPTPEQAKFIGKRIGAKRYIESQLEFYKKDRNYAKYQEFELMHPTRYARCFQGKGGDIGFNTIKINDAYERLNRSKSNVITGNFKWEVKIESNYELLSAAEFLQKGYHHLKDLDAKVKWIPDDNSSLKIGRFENSLAGYPQSSTNLKIWNPELDAWSPQHPERFTAGADTFRYLNKQDAMKRMESGTKDSGHLSDGGGSMFYERDLTVDPDGKDINTWESYRTMLTYLFRPDDKNEYCEEMLMMCIYFGAMMFPEMNINSIYEWFCERGYKGYLLYAVHPITGKFNNTPGITSLEKSKQEMFDEAKFMIEHHFNRERHFSIVRETKEIKGIDDLKNHDLFCAWALCLLGSRRRTQHVLMMNKKQGKKERVVNVNDIYGEEYSYN